MDEELDFEVQVEGAEGSSQEEGEFDLGSAVEAVAEELKETPEESQVPTTEVKGEEKAEAESTEQKDLPPIAAPKTWRKEAAEAFSTLPKVVQDEVLKREDDIFKGIEHYKNDATFGQKMRMSVEKYLPVLERYGIPVEAQVAATMDAHYRLALGSPEEKLAVVQQIIQDYGVDAARVVSEVGLVSPEVSQLQTRIRALESQLNADAQQREFTARSEVERQITEFSRDPANPHFEVLANDMAAIIRGEPGISLKDAYAKAVWANPQTRELELAKQRAEVEEKARAAAAERKARVAASTAANVRASAKSGSAAAPIGTMDDTIRETLAKIKGEG